MVKRKALNLLLASLAMSIVGGCASTMSGLEGESRFSCKAPDGVTCSSLSGVYANAVANELPALRKESKPTVQVGTTAKPTGIIGRTPTSGDPIRTSPKILRIWIAPWEDSEGDLHDQSFVYVVSNPGRWVIEHNRRQIADSYRPTFIKGNATQNPPATEQRNTGTGVVLPGSQMQEPNPQVNQE